MQRRLIPIPNWSEEEYQLWLKERGIVFSRWFTTWDLVCIEKMRKERRLDAIMRHIHSDGLEEWRKQHNQS